MTTIVKRIKPYPIDAEIFKEGTQGPMMIGKIVKLVQQGCLVNVGHLFFKPQEHYMIRFHLRTTETTLTEKVSVVKTYLSFDSTSENVHEKFNLVEFHFVSVSGYTEEAIRSFRSIIGQKE